MVNQGLIDWLNRNKDKGYPKEKLREYLQSYGYTAKDIEDAFTSLNLPKEQSIESLVVKKKTWKRPPWLVLFLTFITFGLYWFYWFFRTSREVSDTTGLMPRRWFLIPAVILVPILCVISMMLFTANLIDTPASRTFIQYGSLIFVGVFLIFVLFIGTFSWTYSLAIQPLIELPAWLTFVLMVTLIPSVMVMYITQAKLNIRASA
jgi:hypothetical protein